MDADKNQVQALTHQQRLLSLQNDLAKQKINLARMIGLPPNDQYEITDDVPFRRAAPLDRGRRARASFRSARRFKGR